jgi:hypothetical protein
MSIAPLNLKALHDSARRLEIELRAICAGLSELAAAPPSPGALSEGEREALEKLDKTTEEAMRGFREWDDDYLPEDVATICAALRRRSGASQAGRVGGLPTLAQRGMRSDADVARYLMDLDHVVHALTGDEGEDDSVTVLQHLARQLGDRTIGQVLEQQELATPTAGVSEAKSEPTRYFASGPEGFFYTDNLGLAERILLRSFYDDEWTVTDLHNPTGATPP